MICLFLGRYFFGKLVHCGNRAPGQCTEQCGTMHGTVREPCPGTMDVPVREAAVVAKPDNGRDRAGSGLLRDNGRDSAGSRVASGQCTCRCGNGAASGQWTCRCGKRGNCSEGRIGESPPSPISVAPRLPTKEDYSFKTR